MENDIDEFYIMYAEINEVIDEFDNFIKYAFGKLEKIGEKTSQLERAQQKQDT